MPGQQRVLLPHLPPDAAVRGPVVRADRRRAHLEPEQCAVPDHQPGREPVGGIQRHRDPVDAARRRHRDPGHVSAPAGAVGTYRKTGKMTISLAVQRRFWPKVALTGDDASGCWLWTAATIRGYGAINIAGQARYA